jgi:hypothetical protein
MPPEERCPWHIGGVQTTKASARLRRRAVIAEDTPVDRAVEWYLAITVCVVGASHVLRPGDWAEAYRRLHAAGHPGAFVNGGLHLASGAAVVAGHGSWAWPGAVLTAFGWLLVAKGLVCLVAPQKARRSMAVGGGSPRGFLAGGVVMLAVGGWAWYCLWRGAPAA